MSPSPIVEKQEPKSVKIAQETSSAESTTSEDQPLGGSLRTWIGAHTEWIEKNWNWSKLKPVIRCTVVGWVSVVLFVIPRVEIFLGQASFLILLAAFFSPPGDPFISVLEREILILLFVSIAWAWACLGIFLANLTRRVHNPAVTILDVVNGQFVEAAPSVILGIFIFFGSAFFLYIKARQGFGPYFFASAFACICLDITLTTAVLFPLPFYLIGKSIILPLAFHSALALVGSILIFPSTISAQFTTRLQDVLTPLISAIDLHRTLLNTPFPIDSDTPSSSMNMIEYTESVNAASTSIKASEAALGPLAASARLMKSDLIYGRFAPLDFKAFQKMFRQMSAGMDGLATFFSIVGVGPGAGIGMGTDDSGTPAHTVPNTPGMGTPAAGPSRRTSLDKLYDDEGKPHTPSRPHSIQSHSNVASSPRHSVHDPQHHHHSHHHSHSHPHNHHHLLHTSLVSISRPSQRMSYDKPNRGHETEHAVGTFESQRYLNLEATRLWDPNREEWTRKSMQILGESCDPVLEVCRDGLTAVNAWLGGVRNGRFTYCLGIRREERDREVAENAKKVKDLREKICSVLESFRGDKRLRILDPYRPVFETSTSPSRKHQSAKSEHDDIDENYGTDNEYQTPPHRYLFHSYFYQYHLIQVCSIVIEILDEIIKLEKERTHDRLWTPVGNIFGWNKFLVPEDAEQTEDDDPDVIQGIQHDLDDEDKTELSDDLGIPRGRDPDALPPRNSAEWVMTLIHSFIMGLGGGNALFAIKASLLTVLLCLPYFFKSSAPFAYQNSFVWGVFVGQITIARFRGDTAFGLIARIGSTFFGGLTGLVMWYVSAGSTKGNPFGLAAVCGVCFPFFFFARLYAPIPPATNIVYFVTACLVIGYSYQDGRFLLPNSPGFGWTIAWRRFVLVTAGAVAAFLVSFLPPSTTIRIYHRNLLSTTSAQLGTVYCAILSFASTKSEPEIQEIISSLLAIRAKLNRSVILRTNVTYEFSLRGRWPKERYHKIVDLQIAISYSLSNLISVLDHLEPSWARAFLRRTRFMDPDFQGDVLAIISMISSSLRTGCPLPQITPCPLLDRFLLQYHGLNVIHKEAGEDYGLPRSMSLDTLKNEQYLMFCVGITTSFRIVNRLDQLMLATKEVVGEHYHIHGVGVGGGASANPILKEGARPITMQFQPPGGVV
ncbi:hypothetical protein BYT27DRAFT_7336184 [Phlegmacium glaucopus]|nr:hypothetical protein BYT27DRAFT_7336184 [Phlegmacium glaucopus]